MAENHEPGKWDAVVCSGFAAVNVLSSTNVEELGWDYTEMELDPTGTCGLFDGMLLDWDDDTPEERREHEEFFPDAFTVGARILALPWRRAEACAGVLQAGEGQRRQEPCGDSCRSKGRRGE